MADPEFPMGGAPTCWGGANLRCIHFLAKTYAKTKEMDPAGGHVPVAPPGSATDHYAHFVDKSDKNPYFEQGNWHFNQILFPNEAKLLL